MTATWTRSAEMLLGEADQSWSGIWALTHAAAMGGFTAARREVVQMLRQKSRPYLFSNSLAPGIAGASLAVLKHLSASTALRDRLSHVPAAVGAAFGLDDDELVTLGRLLGKVRRAASDHAAQPA